MNLFFGLSMGGNGFAMLENMPFHIRSEWRLYLGTAAALFGICYLVLYWGMCNGKRIAGLLTAWVFGASMAANVIGLLFTSPRKPIVGVLGAGGLVFAMMGLFLLHLNWSWYRNHRAEE